MYVWRHKHPLGCRPKPVHAGEVFAADQLAKESLEHYLELGYAEKLVVKKKKRKKHETPKRDDSLPSE